MSDTLELLNLRYIVEKQNDLPQLHMTSRAIACRLRTLRQKSGLSQIELARILGFHSEIPVSRHELSLRLPSLLTALGYSIVFRVPLDEIFPGMHGTVEAVIEERLAELEVALGESTAKGLLTLYTPDSLVVLLEDWRDSDAHSDLSGIKQAVIQLAAARAIPIQAITRSDLRASFGRLRCETRDEIAASLGRMFPELAWQVPPVRRIWQSEHPRMIIFDAIAFGFTYWLCSAEAVFEPEEEDVDMG